MAYVAIASDLNGHIFSIDHTGALHRNWQESPGAALAHSGLGQRIGDGWQEISHFVATRAAGRVLLAGLHRDGTLYTADAADGAPVKHPGTLWLGIRSLLAGHNGSLFGLMHNGDIEHRLHPGAPVGTAGPAGAPPLATPPSWSDPGGKIRVMLFTNGSQFFDITLDGELRYFATEWLVLGCGWGKYQRVFALTPNSLCAMDCEGTPITRNLKLNSDGTIELLPLSTGAVVGDRISGWFGLPCLVEGYATPQSGAPGDTISFHTAARQYPAAAPGPFSVTFVRLRRMKDRQTEDDDTPLSSDQAQQHVSSQRDLPPDWLTAGAQWPETFRYTIPAGTRSGLCAARCVDQQGQSFYIPFIARPAARSAPFAVLANTNTWNAYNSWGGEGKYVHKDPPPQSIPFERPHPGLTPDIPGNQDLDGNPEIFNQSNHLVRAELWVLGWLDSLEAKYAYDMYTDRDLHNGIPGITDTDSAKRYRALILTVHPEYWTFEMYDAVKAYQQMGGSILYFGGNGIYEQVVFEPSGIGLGIFPGLTIAKGDSNSSLRMKCLLRTKGRPERALIGVGYETTTGLTVKGNAYQLNLSPDESPVLKGVNTPKGGWLGGKSANIDFCADGWEIDERGPDSPPAAMEPSAVLATTGQGTKGNMLYYEVDGPNNGIVFAGSSLDFCGSLAVDTDLQTIVRNVLDITLQRQC